MPDPSEGALRFSEANRRRLYEQVTERLFGSSSAGSLPDRSLLQVIYFGGRWFATWLDLNEPLTLPIEQRFRISRISLRQDRSGGIELYDV